MNHSILSRFSTMKVAVVGDVMLDLFEYCHSDQSKPIDSEKPGARAYKAQKLLKQLGGAGNVAANLTALGVHTYLIGVTGNDGHHLTLKQLAEQSGIHYSFIRDSVRPTTTKNRLYLDGEYLLRRDDEANHPIPEFISTTVFNEVTFELDGADAVILSDYNKGVFSEVLAQDIIRACRERRIPVIVDFKPPNRSYFRDADIIAPNATEAEAIWPEFDRTSPIKGGLRKLYDMVASRNLIVTLGAHGICGTDGNDAFHIPAIDVPAMDAVGCGDTTRALLALGHAAGLPLPRSAELANLASSIVVQKIGTDTVSIDELKGQLPP